MHAIEAFRILPAGNAEASAKAKLMFGDRTVAELAARVVEAQFQLEEGGYVVFASLDSPYEEELTILCFDAALHERDRETIGQPYMPGLLQEVRPLGATRLGFRFARPEPWTLDVAPRRAKLGLRTKWLHLV